LLELLPLARIALAAAGRGGTEMLAMSPTDTAKQARLLQIIKSQSLFREKSYALASGGNTDYYFNMKNTTMDPEGANLVADLIYSIVSEEDVDFLGGLASGAIPIITTVAMRSLHGHRPIRGFYVREEVKTHGMMKLIECFIEDGSRVIILDDVTTIGSSAMKAVNAVRDRHCRVTKVISIVDRLEGATETFKREGIEFTSLFTTRDFMAS
jgi:orotate phosphoribosyltransferase